MMPFSVSELVRLALRSLSEPKVVMREVLEFEITRAQLLQLTLLLVVFDLIAGLLLEILIPGVIGSAKGLSQSIFSYFTLHLATILGGTVFLFYGGRTFGGQGDFDQCFKAMIWLNFVFLLLQFVVPIARVFSMGLEGYAFLAMILLGFIQLTAYVMVVHKFIRIVPVIFGIFGAQLLFGVALIILLSMLGIDLQPELSTNV